jgi:integrase
VRSSGRSSGVEHNLAKVGVEGSNPFARSNIQRDIRGLQNSPFPELAENGIYGSYTDFPFRSRILAKIGPLESSSGTGSASSVVGRREKGILDSRTFKDGAIYLFLRPDYKKPTWFCRVKVPNTTGYVWRSTGTTDEHAAYAFADALYNRTLVKALSGEAINAKRLGPALDAYIKRLEPDQSRQSVHNKILLIKRITPFLASKTFDDVDTALLSTIIDEATRLSAKERLSPNTISRINSDLKHLFGWCVDEGYLSAVPRFPRIAGDKARRTNFGDADWRKLTRYLREFVKVENKAVRRDRVMLVNYVLILANTGIRVGEARHLKWRDVREVDGEIGKAANIVLTVSGKTGVREVVARTPEVKGYFKRILDLRLAELATPDTPKPVVPDDSLIFCHPDGSPIGSFKKSFLSLIRLAGVERDSHGQLRTIYSLRHTYATFRLHEGVHQFILARNMGTSVAMLEQYYGHTGNVTSAVELTKTAKKRQTGGKSSGLNWLQ